VTLTPERHAIVWTKLPNLPLKKGIHRHLAFHHEPSTSLCVLGGFSEFRGAARSRLLTLSLVADGLSWKERRVYDPFYNPDSDARLLDSYHYDAERQQVFAFAPIVVGDGNVAGNFGGVVPAAGLEERNRICVLKLPQGR